MKPYAKLLALVAHLTADADTAEIYAAHLWELLFQLSPERLGADFANALARADYAEALALCAAHFRAKAPFPTPDLTCQGEFDRDVAERAIRGNVTEVNVEWQFPDGKIDFLFNPTKARGPVNHEWLWQLNRHSYWIHMARAYAATGDEAFAVAFQDQLLRWIGQASLPEVWNAPDSAWRTIECGIRLLGSWMVAFDGFRTSSSVDDLALLLMVASMHRQTVHLVAHPTAANWLMMESNGVYTCSALFDEFADAHANRAIATARLVTELSAQILPDGMHNELSPDYQNVVLSCACGFYSLAQALGAEAEIPQEFVALVENTIRAALLLSTPALTQPRTNDTYTIPTAWFASRGVQICGEKPEYTYVSTARAAGTPLAGETASAFLPYAGFAVMRSDWGAEATYLCFDVGPLGRAHCHQDKLNINLFKGATELLYDDGGGHYDKSPQREYARSGYGHNTVLVDGLAQYRKEPLVVTQPIHAGWVTCQTFDYAEGVYDDTFGIQLARPATHKRQIRFCKPDLFCVSDTLTSLDEKPHSYELLFHLNTTEVTVLPDFQNGVLSHFGGDWELAILPLDAGEVTVVSAVTEPQMQGWYNGRNDADLHPAVTVTRAVSGVTQYRFDTLLVPIRASDPLPQITRCGNRVTVHLGDKVHQLDLEKLDQA